MPAPTGSPFRRLRLLCWLVTAAWWVLIATLTHLPPSKLPRVPGSDKTHHFLAYAALALLLGFALMFTFPRRWWLPWAVLVVGMCYGALDEVTQSWVGRTTDIEDWIADAVGTAAGILPVLLVQRWLNVPARAQNVRPARASGEGNASTALGAELEAALRAAEAPGAAGPAGAKRRRGP
jgi:VanZ family protein